MSVDRDGVSERRVELNAAFDLGEVAEIARELLREFLQLGMQRGFKAR